MNIVKESRKILFIFTFCFAFAVFSSLCSCAIQTDEKKYYSAISKFAGFVRKKYGYDFRGEGGSVNPDGSIKVISLAFDAPHFSGNDSARRELIELCQEAIEFFNKDPYIQENRHNELLSWDNIDIAVFFRDKNGNKLYTPNLWAISKHKQYVMIFIDDPKDEYNTEVIKESIEEALNKVKAEQ